MNRDEAQKRLDEICMELNDLYRQVREKDVERDKYDRIVHAEDYEASDEQV